MDIKQGPDLFHQDTSMVNNNEDLGIYSENSSLSYKNKHLWRILLVSAPSCKNFNFARLQGSF
jgi:hypothetical protein